MSALLARMREVWREEMADQIRDELRQGATIAEVMNLDPMITKRMVEEQRSFLRQTEELADTRRNDTGIKVAQMEANGKTSAEIMRTLKITRSTLHYHRRKSRKVS